ncbi:MULTISPECIES: SpoIIE family protein phosphatase [unclassified Frankia]|uniref:SpoIIE family protein phosphatase n=1 Tax=unclassified Frankia TaxID=2632575 RepID=UPI001EF598DA|nr:MULTISPECIES: SpoIIE family protein phosphatase [unclassified Frankia]
MDESDDVHVATFGNRIDELFDVAETATATVDAQGRITQWSKQARQLLAYPPAEVLGRAAADLLAEDIPDTVRLSSAALEVWSGQAVVRHRDGRHLRVELLAQPSPADDGKITWIISAVLAGRQKRQMRKNHEQQDKKDGDWPLLDWAFDQSPLYLAVYDVDLRIRRLNAAACRQLGIDQGEERGLQLTELLPGGPALDAVVEQLRKVAQTGEPVRYRVFAPTLINLYGEALAISISPLKDPDGLIRGVYSAAFDISEQHRAQQRLALLNEASSRIGSTLNVIRTARELVEVVVPGLADWASVDLLESVRQGYEPVAGPFSGTVTLCRAAHQSIIEGRPEVVVELGQADVYPDYSPPARVLVTGRPALYQISDPVMARWVAADAVRTAKAREYGFHSMLFVPLRARGATLGVATLARHRHPEAFEHDDLILADELAARAAVAIDNARRYTHERATALTLQRSLLPRRLPAQTAVDVASRYLPASSEVGVGGDWYDVIPLSGTRVALVVGDVAGHGLHAAATMGRLRTAVRTLADVDFFPEELLTRLDDVVIRLAAEESPASTGMSGDTGDGLVSTCLYAVYDPVSCRCSLARAGHALPAIVTPDGTVDFLDLPAGPPLGVGGLPFEAADFDLPAGSLLVFYTDGLVEGHDRDIDAGQSALRRVLADSAGSLESICDTILATMLPDRPSNDVALLVARTRALDPGQVASWDLPAEPAVVADARAQASRQLASWGLDEATFITELIVSELLTNAIRHARAPLQLRLILDDSLICEVSDASSTAPHLRRARVLDEGGRGLLLVAQLTRRWGTRHTRHGKTIWAEQPLPTG